MTPQTPAPTNQPHVSRLVACDKFLLDRWTFDSPRKLPLEDACRLLIVLKGSVSIPGDVSSRPLGKGDTVFLPAVLDEIELLPQSPTVMLCARIVSKWGMGNGEGRETRSFPPACKSFRIPHSAFPIISFIRLAGLKPALQAGRCCQQGRNQISREGSSVRRSDSPFALPGSFHRCPPPLSDRQPRSVRVRRALNILLR